MTEVIDTRESGLEVLDVEPEGSDEDAETLVVKAPEPTTVEIGQTAAGTVTQDVTYFVVASIDGETEVDALTAQMNGIEGEQQEDGSVLVEVDEAAVFISNEDGEMGEGVNKIDGGEIEDAIEAIEERF